MLSLSSDTEALFSFYIVSPKKVLPLFFILTGRIILPKMPPKEFAYQKTQLQNCSPLIVTEFIESFTVFSVLLKAKCTWIFFPESITFPVLGS